MSEKNVSGITKIVVKGFKSIAEECEIDIRPLTILAGANSSGKSSIMQPLLLLKQTLEAPYDPGPLKIDGPNVQFTEAEQFLSTRVGGEENNRFLIQIETLDSIMAHSLRMVFKRGQNGIEIVDMTTEKKPNQPSYGYSERLTLFPSMSPEEIRIQLDQNQIPEELNIEEFNIIGRSRCFLLLATQDTPAIILHGASKLESIIFDSIHLPGLRGNPERIYKLSSTGPRYPGTFEHYTASLIYEWQETKDKRLKTLGDAFHTLGLTGKVGTQKVGDVGIELQVGRLGHDRSNETDMVNITDVGLGVSQVLPVLVAVIVAEPGQLVYLEQPELHLHPRAQVALAQVLADAAKRGVRVVVETHSSLLLLGIQTLVAEGGLSPELVKLHWFTRQEDGVTEVDSVDLDEAGTYGEWPEDFADVSLNAQSRFLDAVDNVKFGSKETS